MKKAFLLLFTLVILLGSCKKDDDNTEDLLTQKTWILTDLTVDIEIYVGDVVLWFVYWDSSKFPEEGSADYYGTDLFKYVMECCVDDEYTFTAGGTFKVDFNSLCSGDIEYTDEELQNNGYSMDYMLKSSAKEIVITQANTDLTWNIEVLNSTTLVLSYEWNEKVWIYTFTAV